MRVITSVKLQEKYPGQNVSALLEQLSPTVDILPQSDYTSVKAHCDTVNEEILIVGNDDVISFWNVSNPAVDSDPIVYSDNPYACTQDASFLLPNKVIARIPDEMNGPSWDYLQTVVTNQVKWQKAKSQNTNWFSLVASVWAGVGNYLDNEFAMGAQFVSPPATINQWNDSIINKQYAYANTHGTKTTPFLYSQNGNTFPIIMKPVQGFFGGTLAWFDACYGAYTIGRNKTQSIPMMALYSNAVACCGSTTIAYGPSNAPPAGIDLLMEKFFKRIQNHEPIGSAFLNAKKDFSAELMQREGGLDGSSRKTLLQTVLYGNPLITN